MKAQEARVAYQHFGKPKLAELLACLKLDQVGVGPWRTAHVQKSGVMYKNAHTFPVPGPGSF